LLSLSLTYDTSGTIISGRRRTVPLERTAWGFNLVEKRLANEFQNIQIEEGLTPLQAAQKANLSSEALRKLTAYLTPIDL
jgi:hypothetical protein